MDDLQWFAEVIGKDGSHSTVGVPSAEAAESYALVLCAAKETDQVLVYASDSRGVQSANAVYRKGKKVAKP